MGDLSVTQFALDASTYDRDQRFYMGEHTKADLQEWLDRHGDLDWRARDTKAALVARLRAAKKGGL